MNANKPMQESDFHTYKGVEFGMNEQPSIRNADGTPYGDPAEWGKYVMRHRNAKGKIQGYSCLGFDVCLERIALYAAWIDKTAGTRSFVPIHANHQRGSVEAFQAHQDLIGLCIEMASHLPGGKCDAELSPQLIGLEGKRVEVVDKFGETRRFIVGKSMGPMVIHLEVKNNRSTGGGAADREYKSVRVV